MTRLTELLTRVLWELHKRDVTQVIQPTEQSISTPLGLIRYRDVAEGTERARRKWYGKKVMDV